MATPRAEFWTPKQAADYLGIHPITMYRWLSPPGTKLKKKLSVMPNGHPPHRRLSAGTILIPIEEFKRWAKGL